MKSKPKQSVFRRLTMTTIKLALACLMLFLVTVPVAYFFGSRMRPEVLDPSARRDHAAVLRVHSRASLVNPQDAEQFYVTTIEPLYSRARSIAEGFPLANASTILDPYEAFNWKNETLNAEVLTQTANLVSELSGPEIDRVLDEMVITPESIRPIPDPASQQALALADGPEYGGMSRLHQVLLIRLYIAASFDDADAFLQDLTRNFALIRHTGMNPRQADRKSADRAISRTCGRIWNFLATHSLTVEELEALAAILDQYEPPRTMRSMFEAEAIVVEDGLRFFYTIDGVQLNRLLDQLEGSSWEASVISNASGPLAPFIDLIGYTKKRRHNAIPRLRKCFDTYATMYEQGLTEPPGGSTFESELFEDHHPVGFLMPPTGVSILLARRADFFLDTTRILVAIERFRLEHGSPPVALAELVPNYLDRVPEVADPEIDADRRFNYCPTPIATTPFDYTLYVDGPDLIDNGAAHSDPTISQTRFLLPGDDFILNAQRVDP